jgi:sugar-specific transcriptional regulator TrmB
MSLLSKLQKLNFNQNQAKTYIALMQIGEGTALEVSQNAGLPKSTVFETLKILNQRKFVSIASRGSKNIFSVANPNILLEDLQDQVKIAEDILPELGGFYRVLKKDKQVRFFEGPRAIEVIINEVLSEAKELKIIGSLTDIMEFYPKYFPTFSRQRVKKKIPLKLLTNDSELAEENVLLDQKQLRMTKVIKNKDFSSMIWIWQGKVGLIATRGKQFAMVIDEPGIFNIQLAMFDLIWEIN